MSPFWMIDDMVVGFSEFILLRTCLLFPALTLPHLPLMLACILYLYALVDI